MRDFCDTSDTGAKWNFSQCSTNVSGSLEEQYLSSNDAQLWLRRFIPSRNSLKSIYSSVLRSTLDGFAPIFGFFQMLALVLGFFVIGQNTRNSFMFCLFILISYLLAIIIIVYYFPLD